jgi:hypothetical protein
METLEDKIKEKINERVLSKYFILLFPVFIFLAGLIIGIFDLVADINLSIVNSKLDPNYKVSVKDFLSNYLSISLMILSIFIYPIYIYRSLKEIFNKQVGLSTTNSRIITQLKNIALWSSETIEKIDVFIYNMHNFLIHAPIYLAKEIGYFDKEFIETKFINKNNDIEAIKSIMNGQGIAVTDPSYLKDFNSDKNDLVILSPIIIKPAIWYLHKTYSGKDKFKPKVFVYDKSSTAWRLGKEFLKSLDNIDLTDLESDSTHLITLDTFCKNFKSDEFISLLSKIDEGKTIIDSLSKGGKVFESFLLINYLLAYDNTKTENQNVINKIIEYLIGFDFLFLTEPESTFLNMKFQELKDVEQISISENPFTKKNIDIKDASKNPNGEYLFTAAITTKSFIKSNPIAVLKFLKGLKLGLLKTQYLKMNDIIRLTANATISRGGRNIMSKAIDDIKDNIEIDVHEYYPKDLDVYIKSKNNNNQNLEIINTTFNYYQEGINKIDFEKYLLTDDESDSDLINIINFISARLKYNDNHN